MDVTVSKAGRRAGRAAFLTVMGVLFACSLASLLYFAPRFEHRTQERVLAGYSIGFAIYSNGSLDGLLGGHFGPGTAELGIRDGDLIQSVDGTRIPRDMVEQAALLAGRPGTVARLRVLHPDGSEATLRVPRDPGRVERAYAGWGITFEARRWIGFTILELASALSLAAAAILLLRRPRDRVAQLLAFSLALTSFSPGVFLPSSLIWIAFLTDALGAMTLLLALLLFPDGRLASRWHWVALGLAVASHAWTAVAFFGSVYSANGPWLEFAASIAIIGAVAVQFRRTPRGPQRQQAKFVLFGVVVSYLAIVLQAIWLPIELGIEQEGLRAWGILGKQVVLAVGSLAIPAGLLISLLRYRLYDADAAISRSAAYAALTLMLGAAFAGSEKIIEVMGEEMFGESSRALAAGLGAAVAAMMVAPLHNRVHTWMERRFQRALVRLRRTLPLTVGDMREFAALDELLARVAGELERGLHATRVAVLVEDEGKPRLAYVDGAQPAAVAAWMAGWLPGTAGGLACDEEDPLFPGRLRLEAAGSTPVGWLLLGPRPDGSFYGKDEREVLGEVADPIARAVHIVRQRADHEEHVTGRIAFLEAQVDRLIAALAPDAGTQRLAV